MKKFIGTIIFVIKDGKVLLAKKRKKIGVGKWNGYGGKLEDSDKTFEECAVREFNVEAGGATIVKENLTYVGNILFKNGDKFSFDAYILVAKNLTGKPKTTDEMLDPTWFDISDVGTEKLPWDQFMPCDYLWLAEVIKGRKIKGKGIILNDNDFNPKCFDLEFDPPKNYEMD